MKIHIKEQPASFHRFEANWTPTIEVLDPDGRERYRFAGYLPADEYLAQLHMGLGKTAFAHKQWDEAQRWFQALLDKFPNSDLAPEALYWVGVCPYQKTHDPQHLKRTAEEFTRRYQESSWAKRSSVWLPKAA